MWGAGLAAESDGQFYPPRISDSDGVQWAGTSKVHGSIYCLPWDGLSVLASPTNPSGRHAEEKSDESETVGRISSPIHEFRS